MKLDYRKILPVGLGFLAIQAVWNIYNVAVPIYLKAFDLAGMAIGAIMAVDNIFAIVFQPVFGLLSDRTNTRYGRRMPFLLVGIPLAAVSFVIIPFVSTHLFLLVTSIIALNFFMSVFRAPTVALMPDPSPKSLRSGVDGVIYFMGGLGATIAFLLGGMLFDIKEAYPFAACSLIMFITVIIIYGFVKEPGNTAAETAAEAAGDDGVRTADKSGRLLNLILLMAAIFFWFAGYNAIETFFSTYGVSVLHAGKSMVSFLLMSFSGLAVISAIPAEMVSRRFGRKKVILAGLCMLIFTYLSLTFIKNTAIMFIIMGIGGISWALVIINSFSMVAEMTNSKLLGKNTGLYYFFSMLASIASPILYGFLKDELGDGILFIYSCIATVIALFFMMLVKHGEAPESTEPASGSLEQMKT